MSLPFFSSATKTTMRRVPAISVSALAIWLGGCANLQRPAGPAKSAGPEAAAAPKGTEVSTHAAPAGEAPKAGGGKTKTPTESLAISPPRGPAEEPQAPTTPMQPESDYVLRIESEPSGATVVINGTPVGKTPYRLSVEGTARGFFREPVLVKVRFIATDLNQASRTVTEEFTAREKIPGAVRFTAEGCLRVAR